MIGTHWDSVALSPEFEQDATVMGAAWRYVGEERRSGLRISQDGGDHWECVGDTPDGKAITLLSPAPLFAKWQVLFGCSSDGILYRSGDGGIHWDVVLTQLPLGPKQLVYAPNIEVNRPVFLVATERDISTQPPSVKGTLYRSGDGGMTWQVVQLPGGVSPLTLAISPNFAQDRLLFVGTVDGRVLPFPSP